MAAAPTRMNTVRSTSAKRDAEEQHLLLQLPGHAEAGHDQHEDEEVVDRQALLGDVAGEVLAAELAPRRTRRSAARRRRRCRRRPPTRSRIRAASARAACARGRRSRRSSMPDDRGDRESPDPEGDVHSAVPPVNWQSVSTGGLSRRRPMACDRQHRRSWDLVMTTLPRGDTPLHDRTPGAGGRHRPHVRGSS